MRKRSATARALISAVPIPDLHIERTHKRIRIPGDPRSPLDPMVQFRFLPSKRDMPGYRSGFREVALRHRVAKHYDLDAIVARAPMDAEVRITD